MSIYNVIFEQLNDYCVDEFSLNVCRNLWSNLWHLPLDTFPEPSPLPGAYAFSDKKYDPAFFEEARQRLMGSEWFTPYDVVEFLAKEFNAIDEECPVDENVANVDLLLSGAGSLLSSFTDDINKAFTRERSGYRLVGVSVAPITNNAEISSLERSLAAPDRFSGARMHMKKALEHYSLKPKPDLSNTIKEAILAVESATRIVVGSDKDTLGAALKKIQKTSSIHPALIGGWSKLYGFTNDEDGIRHASNTGDLRIDEPLAQYMLVSCSAFSNYLMTLEAMKNSAK